MSDLNARRGLLITLAAGLVTLPAAARAEDKGWWSEHDGGGTVVRGSGNVVSEPRSVAPFQAVHLKGGMKLVLRQAPKEALEVRGDDNLLPFVETTVSERDGVPTLEIGSKKGTSYASRTRIVVTVDVASLKSLAISGAGDAVADGLKTGEFQVKVSGSGNVQLRQLAADALALKLDGSGSADVSGRTGKLAVAMAGTGSVAARELQADEVTVSIAGSGDAHVQARRTLAVSIAGSGDVDYTGEPTVRTSIAGSGRVTRR